VFQHGILTSWPNHPTHYSLRILMLSLFPAGSRKPGSFTLSVSSLIAACLAFLVVASPNARGQSSSNADLSGARNPRVSLRVELDAASLGQRCGTRPEDRCDGQAKVPLTLRPLDHAAPSRRFSVEISRPAILALRPGRYQLSSSHPASVGGKTWVWDIELPLTEQSNEVVLSQQNAMVLDATPAPPVIADQQTVSASPPAGNVRRLARTKPLSPKPQIPSPALVTVITVTATSLGSKEPAKKTIDEPASQSVSPEEQREIQQLVDRWITSVKNRDINGLMSCYAPQMTTYFQKQEVPWAEVKRDKEHFFQVYSQIRQLDVDEVRFEHNPSGLESTLRKTWNYTGQRDFSGAVISRLTFEKFNGRLVISAERERLLWQRKSPPVVSAGFRVSR
jgi:hypothetical protein